MNETMVRAGAITAMALMFVGAVMMVNWPDGGTDDVRNEDVAKTLFGETGGHGYALIVFLIGLLLLVALLGGVFLAKEEKE